MKFNTIFLFTLLVFIFSSCTKMAESTVRNGSLTICDEHTVEELIDNFFENPKWESFVGDDGELYVNIEGGITSDGEPVKALLQFIVEDDEFEVNAFEIDGDPQNDLMVLSLLNKMCETAE